jgi:hypothetical protein
MLIRGKVDKMKRYKQNAECYPDRYSQNNGGLHIKIRHVKIEKSVL